MCVCVYNLNTETPSRVIMNINDFRIIAIIIYIFSRINIKSLFYFFRNELFYVVFEEIFSFYRFGGNIPCLVCLRLNSFPNIRNRLRSNFDRIQ